MAVDRTSEHSSLHYLPLNPGEIRVLEVEDQSLQDFAGDNPQMPRVRLKTVTLDDKLQYYALSYMWGDPSIRRNLCVDGQSISVTRNLCKAIQDVSRHMADTRAGRENGSKLTRDIPIWADALCINQTDLDEKSIQVGRMGEIYTKASRVLVFVDQSSPEDDVNNAMSILRDLVDVYHSTEYQKFLKTVPKNASSYSPLVVEKYEKLMDSVVSRSLESAECLSRFVQRPGRWWERVWVMQEVALAPAEDVMILCGPYHLSWSVILSARRWDGDEGAAFGYKGRQLLTRGMPSDKGQMCDLVVKSINTIEIFLARVFSDPPTALCNRLYTNRLLNPTPSKASVQHDVVYSLLSISEDEKSCGIVPDYRKTPQEVFRDVAIYLFRTQESFALQCCWYDEHDSDHPYSWIPNWYGIKSRAPYQFWPGSDGIRAYNASNNRAAWWHRIDGYELRLRGSCAGKVVSIAGMSKASQRQTGEDVSQLDSAQIWLEHFNDFLYSQPEDSLNRPEDAWRLPIADMTIEEYLQRPSPDFKEGYDELSDGKVDLDALSEKAATYGWTLNVVVKGGFSKEAGREVYATSTGFLGLGPPTIRSGDLVYVIAGADIPLVLRRIEDGRYRIIGETFVEGIMDGEFAAVRPPVDEIVIV